MTASSAFPPFTAAIAMRWGLRRFNRVEIRRAMQTLGYELCTQCGYWLKGLGEDVRECPECGASRAGRGTRRGVRLGAWGSVQGSGFRKTRMEAISHQHQVKTRASEGEDWRARCS